MPPVLGGGADVRGRLGLLQAAAAAAVTWPAAAACRRAPRRRGAQSRPGRRRRRARCASSASFRRARAGRWPPRSPRRSRRDAARARDYRLGAGAVRELHRLDHLVRFERRRVRPVEKSSAPSSRRPAGPTMRRRAPSATAKRATHQPDRPGTARRRACRGCGSAGRRRRGWLSRAAGPFTDHGRRLQRGVPRQRPDAHHTISRDDAVEPGDPVDIDDRRRPQEPHAQERHQALPAREQPRVTVEPCEGGERLLHRQCREVLERGRLHQRYDFLIVPYHHSFYSGHTCCSPRFAGSAPAEARTRAPFRDRLAADLRVAAGLIARRMGVRQGPVRASAMRCARAPGCATSRRESPSSAGTAIEVCLKRRRRLPPASDRATR